MYFDYLPNVEQDYLCCLQVSLVATVEPGEDNYIAVDDLELIDVPCVQGQKKPRGFEKNQ